MANNRNIQVNLTGNASNLQAALTTGQTAIQNFGTAAGGTMGNFASTFAGGLGNSATALTGFGAALGVTAGALTATFAKVQESSEKAFETMQAASLSQMGLTQIQQMANMYAKVGLTMENIADQQKDLKDKLADGISNISGSMYTDIIQPLQLNAGALQKMADQGGDVIAKIYYQAKQMGYSESQIINMMETIGNDATKRMTVLKEFNSEQEYQNSLASQTITLTTEQATQFGEYQQATRNLSQAWEAWNNNALAPIAERLASILNLMASIINTQNKIQMPLALGGARAGVSTSNAQSILDAEKKRAEAERTLDKGTYDNMVKYGQLQVNSAEEIAQAQVLINQQKNGQIQKDNANQGTSGFSAKELDTQSQSFQSGTTKIKRQIDILDSAFKAWKTNAEESLSTAYAGNIDALDKDIAAKTADYLKQRDSLSKQVTKEQDDAAAKAKSAAEKAAREQATLAQKNADARAKAEQVIAKAVADTQTDAHALQLAEFDRQQKALVDQINKAAATLGISPAELLGKQATASAANRDTLIKNQLGITQADPNAVLKTQNQDIANLQNSGNLSEDNRNSLVKMQADRVGTTNGMIDTSSALTENDAAMQAELQQNDLLLKGHEDYEKQKAAITAKYNAQAIQISQQNTKTQLTQFADATQSLGDAVSDVFGKNSAAAKAAFIAQKAITIAQTVMNIQLALSNALSIGFPQNIPVYLQVAAMGMSIISSAKSAAGQFHGGIDELPSTMDNKSFVLKAGERVVQPEANTKLTKFLDKQDSNGGSMGDTTVNAPLVINGSTDDDSKFNEMLKKHANNVSLAVRNAQRRNS